MTGTAAQASYDEVPYPSLSYTQTHPDRLATLATLLGMEPAPVERCRVLELGCASGGNLIPMAYGLPGSEFVGIDSSETQIAEGQATAAALKLGNIALRPLNILEVDQGLGQFDYIIAHGVFSWVPRPVQEQLLAICKHNLAPDGVAYVSYNAYPGWHMFDIIRDMMLYHTRDLADPQERVTAARALLDFLAESVSAQDSAYGSFLNTYAQFLRGELKGAHERGDAFLLHDELEAVNEPLYFYQFAERAERHGLQYLAEAEFRTMVDRNFPPQVSDRLREMSRSAVELEQYMDFLRNRMFRQTLLCHQGLTLSHTLKPEQLLAFCVASRAQPATPELDVHAPTVAQFRASDGAVLSTDHPLTKAAMLYLGNTWPRAVPFDALPSLARSRFGLGGREEADAQQDVLILGTNLLKAYTYSSNLVELHVHAPQIAVQVNDRPVASPVARLQAQSWDRVTNLRHERVKLDDLDRHLLSHLDGSHDLLALAALLESAPAIEISQDRDGSAESITLSAGDAADTLYKRLLWFARAALLVA